jgi:hypothetical protein
MHHIKLSKSFLKYRNNGGMKKKINFKIQTICMCLNQTLTLVISKGHILLISKPIWTIFVALDMLGRRLQNLWKIQSYKKQCSKIYESLSTFLSLLLFHKLQQQCLFNIVCHKFEVCKLFFSKWINSISKW